MTLTIHEISLDVKQTPLSIVWPMLTNAALVCWFSLNNTEITRAKNVLTNTSFTIFQNLSMGFPPECKHIVLYDATEKDVHIRAANIHMLTPKHNIYIVNEHQSLDITQLQQTVLKFGVAHVILVTKDRQVWCLSASFLAPRIFAPCSNNELSLHTESKKIPDFQGAVVPIVVTEIEPYVIVNERNGTVNYDGIEMNLFKELSRYLNFSWKVVPKEKPCCHDHWGTPFMNNGTWRGGAGQRLDEGEAELVFGSFWYWIPLLDKRDIGPCTSDVHRIFMVHRPYHLNTRWETLYKLFQPSVWIATFTAFITTSLFYWVTNRLQNSSMKISVLDSMFTMFQLLTMVAGIKLYPHTLTIITLWSFFAMLIMTSMTSTILIRFTLPTYSKRVDTIQDLVEENYILAETYSNVTHSHLVTLDGQHDFINPWKIKFLRRAHYVKLEEAREAAKNNPKLVFNAARVGQNFISVYRLGLNLEDLLSNYRLVRENLVGSFFSFVFRKRSPVFVPLSEGIQRLIQVGIWDYQKKEVGLRLFSPPLRHITIEDDKPVFIKPDRLDMFRLKPVFFILGFGLGLSLIVFAVEILYFRLFVMKVVVKHVTIRFQNMNEKD